MIKINKLFVDFDGVIVNTIAAICDLYNEDFKYYNEYKYVFPEQVKTWNFDELNCASREYINTYFNQQRLYNQSNETKVITSSDRIAQMIIQPVTQFEFKEVDKLSETDRGEGGFGSTGKA